MDYYSGIWRKSRVEVLEQNDRTAKIRLLEFGPRGKEPGAVMRVQLKSLESFQQVRLTDTSWHRYTD